MSTLFSEQLFQLRRSKRLMQKTVAATADIDASYLASLERGRRDPPPPETLERLLKALSANAGESEAIRRSAALTHLQRVIELHESHLQGADTLLRLATAIPSMALDELLAIETLVEGFRRRSFLTRAEGTM